MIAKYNAIMSQHNWDLVPRPPEGVNIIRYMWLYRHKYKDNKVFERYKDKLVVNGNSQQVGIDCDEIFSPVVNRLLFTLF